MITNATLTSITPPPAADRKGTAVYAAATAVNIRVAMTEPSRAQVISLGTLMADVTAVMFVPKAQILAAAISLDKDCRVIAAIDDSDPQTYEVAFARDREKAGGLSHFECFLKGVQT
jgi:hypothetical protein